MNDIHKEISVWLNVEGSKYVNSIGDVNKNFYQEIDESINLLSFDGIVKINIVSLNQLNHLMLFINKKISLKTFIDKINLTTGVISSTTKLGFLQERPGRE